MQNFNSKFKSNLVERCYVFGLDVIRIVDRLPKKRSAWVLADQVIRSSTSIGANIVEGRASSSRLEFKKYFQIALKSANETYYWLNMIVDAGLLPTDEVEKMIAECQEICKMLAAGIIKLKKT